MEEKTPVRELVASCVSAQGGEAWQEFVSRFGRLLHRKAWAALKRGGVEPRPEDIEDLAQEVYCRLLADGRRRMRCFRGVSDGELVRYLGRIVRNVIHDRNRRWAAARRGGPDLECYRITPNGTVPDEAGLVTSLVDRTGSPELRLLLWDQRRQLLAGCLRLVRRRRQRRDLGILRLALLQGWSSPEISRALGGRLSPSSVDSVVYRARRELSAWGLRVPPR